MIDRIAQIQSRWQRIEAERSPQRRKRKPSPSQDSETSFEEEAPEAPEESTEPEGHNHIDLRV